MAENISNKNLNIIVVMPAYNAAKTLKKTIEEIPTGSINKIVLVDDASKDDTVTIAKHMGVDVICHGKNRGYGANQKTCYDTALKMNADIIIMLHPDYQYNGAVIPYAVGFLSSGICDVIIGCRIRTRKETLENGMPFYKYISNRFLTVIENLILGQNLGDFHSGFRAYTRKVLETIPYNQNSDDFVFDTEFLAQAAFLGFRIGDVPIPTRYFSEASSINFSRSLTYGIQTIFVMFKYILQKSTILNSRIFRING